VKYAFLLFSGLQQEINSSDEPDIRIIVYSDARLPSNACNIKIFLYSRLRCPSAFYL